MKKGRSLKEIINGLPPERQERIRNKAAQEIKEYKSLQALRKALGLTQSQVAKHQGIRQVTISNLEKRSDMKLSTLKSYIESLGCELEIFVKITKDDTQVRIEL